MATYLEHDLPVSADVIIIGGGLAGTAALWAIGRAAPHLRTILLEPNDHLGGGSSTASLECFRSCWALPCNAQLMRRSIEVFYNADACLGEGAADAIGVRKHGYLFCGFSPQQAATLRADVDHLHTIGLTHVEYLDTDELRYRFPWLGEKVIAAKFDPNAGSLDSHGLVQAYVRAAPSGQIVLNAKEISILVENGQVRGVRCSKGTIAAPQVVIASGAGAEAVGRSAGVDLPVVVRPRQSFTTAFRHEGFPEDAPLVIGAKPFPHVRPVGKDGAIFGWEYHWNAKGRDATLKDALIEPIYPLSRLKDPRFPSIALMLLARQFGHEQAAGFNDPRYLRGLQHSIGYYVYRDASAAYSVSADGSRQPYHSERAIIDQHPDVVGLFMSIAHVGHGIMTSPAAGELLANKVLGQPLSEPIYADFALGVPWVPYDENAL